MSLDVGLLIRALANLKEQGYEVLSIAGGEPLVYPGLTRLVAEAVQIGYTVQLVTNGLLLTKRRLAGLLDYVSLVAVSFDGAEPTHNLVRGRSDAFRRANTALEVLAEERMQFGLLFGVTRRSLPDVPWAHQRACELGAALLHLHPLVAEGRARQMSDDWKLTPDDCARLFVLGKLLGMDSGMPQIQVDLVAVKELAQAREQYDALLSGAGASLSDLVNPLVIDERGRCLPYTYNMDSRLVLAELGQDWRQALGKAMDVASGALAQLVAYAFDAAPNEPSLYLDWFQYVTRLSSAADADSRSHPEAAVSTRGAPVGRF